jgi:hypothetical protein
VTERARRRRRGRAGRGEATEQRRLAAFDAAERPGGDARHGRIIREQSCERRHGFAIADPSRGECAPRPRGSIGFREERTGACVGGAPCFRGEGDVVRADPLRRLLGPRATGQRNGAEPDR